ncbi:hypothetical protein TNCV_475191 [Trichonephila clavipes]|nr:hypothetical protein TNCV_475191 [Trichonephila clavipes]
MTGFVASSSRVPLKTCRVGQRCMVNLSRTETFSRRCGVLVRRGVPAQVSSTSLDRGSKLRGPLPKALMLLNSTTLILTHSVHVPIRERGMGRSAGDSDTVEHVYSSNPRLGIMLANEVLERRQILERSIMCDGALTCFPLGRKRRKHFATQKIMSTYPLV